MKRLLLALMAASPCLAADADPWVVRWKWSAAALTSATVADIASSRSGFEANPLLRGSDGRFGAKGTAIKVGVIAGTLALQHWAGKRHHRGWKVFAVVNGSMAALTGGIAVRNFRKAGR